MGRRDQPVSRFPQIQTDTLIIREAVSEDLEPICRLLASLFEQEAEFKPDFAAQLQGVGAILDDPEKGRFFVIEEAGRIAGCINLLFVVSTALLEDFVLETSVRGQGWGKLLLNHAIRYAERNGCRRITVLTDSDNLKAQTLYRQMGFSASEMLPMRLVF